MLSVLAIKKNKALFTWLMITLFCIIFAFIYEHFSFGVYSNHMIYMFLYPLILGIIPSLIFRKHLGRLFNDGVLLLTASSLLKGVFEIYGTTSNLTSYLSYLGILCLMIGLILFIKGEL